MLARLFLVSAMLFGQQVWAQEGNILNRPVERDYDIVVSSGYLNVGMYKDFPPYSYEVDGQARGVDADVGRRIAEELGVEFRSHWITPDENLGDDLRNNVWKGHYLAKTRVADVMMRVPYDKKYAYMQDSTGEYINEQVVIFGPYQEETWQIAYDSQHLDGVETIGVFQYHPIGVEIDTLPDLYLSSVFGGRLRSQVKHYFNVGEAFDALTAGDVRGVMAMRAEIDHQLSQLEGDRYRAASNGFPNVGKQAWDVGMAIKHTHRQLGYAIEAIVDKMVREGEMEQIFARNGLRYEIPAYYDQILGVEPQE
ncbi:MAG: transporter substrate-binding domain-containing protein [Marinobacter sp.]|uniref:transporter substrate-binding domain-containing protein n=1 Tax=Marinobacter sp. TaxID=50741 RepID=UPI00299E9F04|nr:transporter substrate-binding domain-containing protein [Marinobacter sp.]MDX1633293.1 transporter substrate-binding domain-containing protein [Marinobacter sp.]